MASSVMWDAPLNLDHHVGIRKTWSKNEFETFFDRDDKDVWFMTEEQRATWKLEILSNWDAYKEIIREDRFDKHLRQLIDMHSIGGGISGGMIVIKQAYGTGKSVLANTHLKLWQLIKFKATKKLHYPYIYWRRSEARDLIKAAPKNTAHSVDEDQRGSASGSQSVIKHLLNMWETIRKTGKLALQLGLNVDIGSLGRAVALEIRPFGYNLETQSSRFIVYNWKGQPLWLTATQRIYRPNEKVYYGRELGTFAEYDTRAEAMSQSSDGIYSERNGSEEVLIRDKIVDYWLTEFKGIKPTAPSLTFEARQLFTPAVEQQMDEIVGSAIVHIKRRMEKAKRDDGATSPVISSSGWDHLRDGIRALVADFDFVDAFVDYFVPTLGPTPSYGDIVQKWKPISSKTGEVLLQDSLGKQIRQRRRLLTPTELSRPGENFIASQLASSVACAQGSDGKNDVEWVTPNGFSVAINVKLTLNDSVRKDEETTPEHKAIPNALVVLVIPRLLQQRLYRITGPKTYLHHTGGRLVAIGGLEKAIQEMVEE